MATKVLVNGRYQSRAGVYAAVKSAIKNKSTQTPYGNVLIIDDGTGAGFGGGSGILGTYKSGVDAIYSFDDIDSFQAFVKGGELWNLGKPLFNPAKGQKGINKLYFVKAATTTPAEMAWTCDAGSFKIRTKDEGVNANGVLASNGNLSNGYQSKFIQVNIPPTVATFVTTTIQAQTASLPKINKVVASGINVGDEFTITQGSTSIKVVANSVLPADLYATLASAYNADSTLSATATASVGTDGLLITAKAVNTNFTQTSSVKAAPAQYAFQIFHGTYKGLDRINGVDFDGVAGTDAVSQLVIQSPAFSKLADLVSWFQNSPDFNEGFELVSSQMATVQEETKATATFTITGYNPYSMFIDLWINDPDYGWISLADQYVYNATSNNDTAQKLADIINTSSFGYTASANNNVVTLTARSGLGSKINNIGSISPWFYNANYTFTDFAGGVNPSTATALITSNDAANKVLASGGADTYSAQAFDAALKVINSLEFTHILSLKSGMEAIGTNNNKLADFVQNKSKYDRILVIAGGFDKAARLNSAYSSGKTAAFFNSDKIVVVHGGVKKKSRSFGFNIYSQLYHAAAVLGRCAGLPPQVPVTLKSIDVDGFVDQLEDQDLEDLIKAGVIGSYKDTELDAFVVGLDVNSLQKNEFLINDDGTTYNWALKRIEAELNKSIILNGKKRFFDPNSFGGNRNTTSPEEVVVWANNHLKERTASDQKDDLLISFSNVKAEINQDNLFLTYDFVPNSEIKAIVSTGTMIEG